MSTNPFQLGFNAAQIYSCATLSLSHAHTHTHKPTHQEWRSIMNEYQSFSVLIQHRTDLFVCDSPMRLPGIWMSHVAYENESFRAYEVCRVTHMNESCRTYAWVMSHMKISHMRMSHVVHMNVSGRSYEWVMSHIWMSHVANMHESRRIYEPVMSHVRVVRVACMNESCPI